MSLAQTFSSAYQVLGQKERMDDRRRQRASDQSIQDLYASGQPVDQGSIQRLLASGADPRSVASIANMLRGQDVDTARVANLQSQMKVREGPMVAGAIKKAFDTFKAKPPEQQTQMEWEKWKQTGRSMLASNGIDPELIPVDADPQTMEMQIGAGYAPGAQDLTMDRQAEMGARQGRFETAQAGMDARSDARIGAANQRAAQGRSAADARSARSMPAGGGGGAAPGGKPPSGYRWTDAGDLEAIPGGPGMKPVGGGGVQIGQKQMANVQGKLQTIALLKQQLENVKSSFTPIKGTFSAGPGGDYIPTEGGQSFDAAVSAISPIVRQLTRTPGEGAMSDYEARLAEAILPSRGKYESVTAQQIQQVEDMVTQLESGYMAMLPGGAQPASVVTPPPGVVTPPPRSAGTPSRSAQGQPAAPASQQDRELTPEEMAEYQERLRMKGVAGR